MGLARIYLLNQFELVHLLFQNIQTKSRVHGTFLKVFFNVANYLLVELAGLVVLRLSLLVDVYFVLLEGVDLGIDVQHLLVLSVFGHSVRPPFGLV